MEEIYVGSLTLLKMNSSIGNGRHHKHKNILKHRFVWTQPAVHKSSQNSQKTLCAATSF